MKTAVELLKQRLIKDQQIFPIYTEYINGILYDIDNELLEIEREQQGYSEDELLDIMAITWIRCIGRDGNNFKELRDEILEQVKKK